MYVSDAVRALTTANYFKEAFSIKDEDFTVTHQLYDFSGHNVIDIIKQMPDKLDRAMSVGHNHAFTSMATMLGNRYIDNVPTCGFVQIEFDVDSWDKIVLGKTVQTVFPRDLKK
jgi:phosphohistidine phosphatase